MITKTLFERVHTLKHDELTKENWFKKQPGKRVSFAGNEFMLNQPTSTFWVYLLGVLVCVAGGHFLMTQDEQQSRFWWGIALMLWGIGALVAGTSYQALGYELKCARREQCSWTTWWEVIYLILQQVSLNAMTIAVAYSCSSGLFRDLLIGYSIVLSVAYTASTLYGAFKPVKSLITFEFMVLVSLPSFTLFCFLNLGRYLVYGQAMDLVMLGSWALIYLSWWGFNLYDKAGWTEKLWQRGRWFSENDVLHVVLIVWGLYTLIVLPNYITDYAL